MRLRKMCLLSGIKFWSLRETQPVRAKHRCWCSAEATNCQEMPYCVFLQHAGAQCLFCSIFSFSLRTSSLSFPSINPSHPKNHQLQKRKDSTRLLVLFLYYCSSYYDYFTHHYHHQSHITQLVWCLKDAWMMLECCLNDVSMMFEWCLNDAW